MTAMLRFLAAVLFLFVPFTAQFSLASAVSASSPDTSAENELGQSAAFLIPEVAQQDEHLLTLGMTSRESEQSDISIGSNWPMFKKQTSRLSSNPFERIINRDNVESLGLSWVGVMGDLVDYSSPAISNGVVYIASLDGNLYAFNANGCGQGSCNPLWVGTMNNNYSSVSSPAVANGLVYVGSEDHKLYVFAAAGCGHGTCAPLWTANTGGAVFSSPLVAGNAVYVGSEDHRFYAFPANGCGRGTCTPLWIGNTGGAIDSSPALGDGVVYVGSQDGKLYAFGANGCGGPFCRPLWTGQVGQSIFSSSPAVNGAQVYIASFAESDFSSSKLYSFNASGCGHSICQPLWTGDAGEFVASSPAVANGRVYIGSGDDLLYVFDANGCHQPTCTALWRGQAIGAQAAMISTPAVANGVVFVGENNGMVEVFDGNGCGDSICLPLTQLHTNNEPIVSSSPAVINGTVYFGSADQFAPPIGRLYVFKLMR